MSWLCQDIRILLFLYLSSFSIRSTLSTQDNIVIDVATDVNKIKELEQTQNDNQQTTPAQDTVNPILSASDTSYASVGVDGEAKEEIMNGIDTDIQNTSMANSTDVPESRADENEKNTTKVSRATKVKCLPMNATDKSELSVQILNSSVLPTFFQTVPNLTEAACVLSLFYAPWCHFSASASLHYNALPRLFPDINCIAINSATYSNFNARYGTIAVPTLLLFHNGLPFAKFNDTHYTLEKYVEFIKKYTGLNPVGEVKITSADLKGPLQSTPVQEPDYLLWLAWTFLVSCSCYGFTKSVIWHRMIETLRNNWQEAEAQHEHVD